MKEIINWEPALDGSENWSQEAKIWRGKLINKAGNERIEIRKLNYKYSDNKQHALYSQMLITVYKTNFPGYKNGNVVISMNNKSVMSDTELKQMIQVIEEAKQKLNIKI